jgi:hypothetical protein
MLFLVPLFLFGPALAALAGLPAAGQHWHANWTCGQPLKHRMRGADIVTSMLSYCEQSWLHNVPGCKQMRLACVRIVCTATSVTSPVLFEANIRSKLDLKAKHSWVHLPDESDRHGNAGATS